MTEQPGGNEPTQAARWGLTWVGGTLWYDTREGAERAQRLYVNGRVIRSAETGETHA